MGLVMHRRTRVKSDHIRQLSASAVGWPEGISPSGSHRSRRDSLPSPGSSCSRFKAGGQYHAPVTTHCQCGRSPGFWVVTRSQARSMALIVLSRLYLALTHFWTWQLILASREYSPDGL